MGTPQTLNLTTYTQTPNCGYTMTYSYTVDDILDLSPDWLTFNFTSLSIDISTSNVSYVGSHNISVTTSYAPLNYSDITSITITMIIPCSMTFFNPNTI
jgi:hypothetical protein